MITPSTTARALPVSKLPGLPIIFRKHYDRAAKRWDVTAFFPTLFCDSSNWYNMTCYARIGQHGGACAEFYRQGKPASAAEYADLLAELRSIYEKNTTDSPVRLIVYRRETAKHRAERESSWRAMRATA